MGSINISLKKEAYDFLKGLKSKDKSFSDVILGFKEFGYRKGSREAILDFIENNSLDIDWKVKEEQINKNREDMEKELEERRIEK